MLKNMVKQILGALVLLIVTLGVLWIVGMLVQFLENNLIWIVPIVVLDFYLLFQEI